MSGALRTLLLLASLPVAAVKAAPPLPFDPVVFEEIATARGVRFLTNSGRTAATPV